MKYKKTLSFIDKHRNDLLTDLQTLISQPSISAKNEGIEECSILEIGRASCRERV